MAGYDPALTSTSERSRLKGPRRRPSYYLPSSLTRVILANICDTQWLVAESWDVQRRISLGI